MKNLILLFAVVAIAFTSCKKEPMYMDKPTKDIYRVKSLTNGIRVHLYEQQVTSVFQVDKNKTVEYSTSLYYKIKVECPTGDCTYFINGIKQHETREYEPNTIR